MSGSNQSAPLPRDADEASFSEMVPFRSKKVNLLKSPIFYFVGITAVLNVVLFTLWDTVFEGANIATQESAFYALSDIALLYILGVSLLAFHSYARTDKSVLYYIFPCVAVYFFMTSGLWDLIYVPWNELAGGDLMEKSPDFGVRALSAIAGPGLREELVKGLPSLFAAAITVWAAKFKWIPPKIYQLIHIRTPLDGVLMGFAAGCSFLYFETSGQYIHHTVITVFKATHGNVFGAFGAGIMLLLPRAMNGWVGHMAWAGTFGYFIGLAVIRPRHMWKLLAIGWVVPAVLHGLWDSDAPGGEIAKYLIGGVGGLLAIACLVKARQLESSLFGRSTETFGSIVVGAPATPYVAQPAAAPYVPPLPQAQSAQPAYAPSAFQPQAAAPVTAPPAAAPASAPSPAVAAVGFALAIENLRLPLQSGGILDLGAQPSLSGRGQGVKIEVTRHPTNPDILGLKNLGTVAWSARLRDNSVHTVEAQRSLRLASGVSIDFGGGLMAQIVGP